MKNPCRFVAVVATLCLFAGAALAQTPSKSAKVPTGNGNGGGAGTVGNILCDDPCNNAQYGFASQCFPDFPSFTSATYDDCQVPDGVSWSIVGFKFDGFYNYSPHCPTSYKFCVTRDIACTPDCGNWCYFTEVPAGSAGLVDGPNCLGLPDGAISYCPGGVLKTIGPGGNWWFSGGVNMPFAYPTFCGQWYWTGSTTPFRKGCSPYLDNPGGGFGIPPCSSWATVLGISQDEAFTVYGDIGGGCTSSDAGSVDTGNGNPPAVVLTFDGGTGTVVVDCTDPNHQVCLSNPPSVKGKFHYALWCYGPFTLDTIPCTATIVNLTTGKGVFYQLDDNSPQCLPSNNTTAPGSCPCPVAQPAGRSSKSFGAGTAAALCVAKKSPFPKAPICFTSDLTGNPSGTYFLYGALVQDLNSPNSPAKNVSVANWVLVCCI